MSGTNRLVSRAAMLAAILAAHLAQAPAEAQFVGGSGRSAFAPRHSYSAGGISHSGRIGFPAGYRFSYFYGLGTSYRYRRSGYFSYGYGYPAYGYGGYGYGPYSYGFRVRRFTPYGLYPRYWPGDPPLAGPISYPAPVYTTTVVPSAEDGRMIVVDMIRGGRTSGPTYGPPRPVIPSPPVDPDSLTKPEVSDDTLAGLLEHTDPAVRRKAAEVLVSRGASGIAALQRAAEPNHSPYLRSAAFFVLARAASNAGRADLTEEVHGTLRDALQDPSSEVRRAALQALTRMPGDPPPESLAKVTVALRDQSQGVREEAVKALVHWRENAIAPLVTVLASGRDQARDAASQALGRIGPAAVDPLVTLLENPRASVRFSAASALGDIGLPAAAARASLAKLAEEDPDPNVRYYARSALARIDP